MVQRIGLFPGSFDPITLGHMDLIRRSLKIVDKLVIGIGNNIQKKPLFSLQERINLARQAVKENFSATDAKRISFDGFTSLTVEFAQKCKATVIIRGVRVLSDFELEMQIANVNKRLNDKIVTLFLPADENMVFVSSRLVREVASFGGVIGTYVPPNVVKALRTKFVFDKK